MSVPTRRENPMNAINERASVRQYTSDPVSDDQVRDILRAAMAAPSAGNQQPWEVWVVRDESKRAELAASSPYAKPCLGAPLVLVFCQRSEVKFPFMVEQDMGACVENALLRITELGLGAVWMGIYPLDDRVAAVRDALAIPSGLDPFALVSVGYPAGTVTAKGPERYDESRVHWE